MWLLKVARPGFWLTSIWFYLLPLGRRAVWSEWTFWLGLFYVTLPLGLLIYGLDELGDVVVMLRVVDCIEYDFIRYALLYKNGPKLCTCILPKIPPPKTQHSWIKEDIFVLNKGGPDLNEALKK